jgi:hypothetical protein
MAVRLAPGRSTSVAILFGCRAIALAVGIELVIGAPLGAQQVQVLPSQQKPSTENLPRNQAPSSQQELPRMPGIPVMPGGPGSNMREIPLPEVFKGCWSGEVAQVDSITPLTRLAGRVHWLTKIYTLCYKQVGVGDNWHLTFAEASVAQRSMVSDQRQSISVKSVSGGDRAELTAYLHFRSPQITMSGEQTGVINTLDELTQLHCIVTPDRSAMNVEADVFIENNDVPWMKMTWHTHLSRTRASN